MYHLQVDNFDGWLKETSLIEALNVYQEYIKKRGQFTQHMTLTTCLSAPDRLYSCLELGSIDKSMAHQLLTAVFVRSPRSEPQPGKPKKPTPETQVPQFFSSKFLTPTFSTFSTAWSIYYDGIAIC